MIKKSKFFLYLLLAILPTITNANEIPPLKKITWSFDGIFGSVDRKAAQRGFQVYKEVCSVCHGLYNLYYRNLKELGFSDAEIKEIAKNYMVKDGPNDQGDMFERPAAPSDHFVGPYPNEQAARASNNGAYPPDLSLLVKARHDGPNYLYSLLTGYQTPPVDVKVPDGLYYNLYYPSRQIAMPPPLSDNLITYLDGTKATTEQMAYDVVNFLQWASEPEMEQRKLMGLKVIGFLIFFTVISYIAKNRIWNKLEK